jgi:hypothetical protein
MRRRKLWQAMLVGLAAALLLTAVAGAAPKDKQCPGHPSCPDEGTTTTTIAPEPEAPWTCVARARNGASAWVIGDWVATDGSVIEYFDRATLVGDPTDDGLPVPDHYSTHVDGRAGVPACFDIHPAHFGVTNWRVEWAPAPGSSTSEKGKLGGLKMQFEREVHGDLFWEYVARSVEARYCTTDPVVCDPELTAEEMPEAWQAPQGELDSLVFVAMPSNRDSWIFDAAHRLTVTPNP